MIAHAIKTLYLGYPRYPGGWIVDTPRFIDSTIFIRAIFIETMPFFRENVRHIFLPFNVLGASVYCSYRYNNARKCGIFNETLHSPTCWVREELGLQKRRSSVLTK